MNKTQKKIATGLEKAFAQNGFTELGVDQLRDSAQVSLRTLYKYCPSKEDMIIMALENRHTRYLSYMFEDLPENTENVSKVIFDRVETWMLENVSQGCLFHSAVASYPHSEPIRKVMEQHKKEVADKMAETTNLLERRDHLLLIHEGVVQSWPILGSKAVMTAKCLLSYLLESDPEMEDDKLL